MAANHRGHYRERNAAIGSLKRWRPFTDIKVTIFKKAQLKTENTEYCPTVQTLDKVIKASKFMDRLPNYQTHEKLYFIFRDIRQKKF
jgi:hypothetical protein